MRQGVDEVRRRVPFEHGELDFTSIGRLCIGHIGE